MQMKEWFDSNKLIFLLLAINFWLPECVFIQNFAAFCGHKLQLFVLSISTVTFFNTNLFWLRADLAGRRTRQRSLPQVLRYIWCLFVSKCARPPPSDMSVTECAPRQPRVYMGIYFIKTKCFMPRRCRALSLSCEQHSWMTSPLCRARHTHLRECTFIFIVTNQLGDALWVTLSVFCW